MTVWQWTTKYQNSETTCSHHFTIYTCAHCDESNWHVSSEEGLSTRALVWRASIHFRATLPLPGWTSMFLTSGYLSYCCLHISSISLNCWYKDELFLTFSCVTNCCRSFGHLLSTYVAWLLFLNILWDLKFLCKSFYSMQWAPQYQASRKKIRKISFL